jgi:protein-tyrosine-phosphatase
MMFAGNLPDSLTRTITVESAGVDAESGSPMCPVAQKWVVRHGVTTDTTSEHRSRRVTVNRVNRADLILAADSEVKSAVLRSDLRVRGKLFTLLEAATLATGVEKALADSGNGGFGGSDVLQLEEVPRRPGDPRLKWLVAEMDAARGLVVPPAGRRRGSSNVDVADPHSGRGRPRHRVTLRALSGAVLSVTSAMGAVNAR